MNQVFIYFTLFLIISFGIIFIILKLKDKFKSSKLISENDHDIINETYPEAINFTYKKTKLFTPAERSFLGVLYQTVNNHAKIFGKVRVADVLTPIKSSRSTWQKAFNKISNKHFDFLLCNNDDFSVICAIELNDKSHQSDKKKQRDNFLKEICDNASLPLIQITTKQFYSINEIKDILKLYL